MTGGLVRVIDEPDGIFLSGNNTSISKDLWVPSKRSAEPPRLPAMPVQPLTLRRGGVDLPSRLFDDIFWLGRHIERCDNAARLVRRRAQTECDVVAHVQPRETGVFLEHDTDAVGNVLRDRSSFELDLPFRDRQQARDQFEQR